MDYMFKINDLSLKEGLNKILYNNLENFYYII